MRLLRVFRIVVCHLLAILQYCRTCGNDSLCDQIQHKRILLILCRRVVWFGSLGD